MRYHALAPDNRSINQKVQDRYGPYEVRVPYLTLHVSILSSQRDLDSPRSGTNYCV
jgi:hypothetical protein